MNTHQIRQKQRQEWIRRQREKHGPDFLQGQDDGTHNSLADFVIFGYAARVFPSRTDTENASSSIGLIEVAATANSSSPVLADRYDVRHLLSEFALMELESQSQHSTQLPEMRLSSQRFAGLDNIGMRMHKQLCEQDIFGMGNSERKAIIDCLADPDLDATQPLETTSQPSNTVVLDYDAEGNPAQPCAQSQERSPQNNAEQEPPFHPSFSVPDGMAVPTTQRHFEVIEHTAQFIANQPSDSKASQVELTIQGKQGTNPDFNFLSTRSDLHPFYKHLRWLIQTNLYGYNNSDSSSESDSEHQEQPLPADPPPVPSIPDNVSVPTDTDNRLLIEKVARLVAKSSIPGKLEQKLRVEKATTSSAYAFLSPFDTLNAYYCFVRDCYIAKHDPDAVSAAVERALDQQAKQTDIASTETTPEDKNDTDSPAHCEDDKEMQAKRRRLALEFLKRKKI